MAFSNVFKIGFKPTADLARNIHFECDTHNSTLSHAYTPLTGAKNYHVYQKPPEIGQ